jgi:hypothetical protein
MLENVLGHTGRGGSDSMTPVRFVETVFLSPNEKGYGNIQSAWSGARYRPTETLDARCGIRI